ncbi:hypothetical protein [Planctomyces sp. SH-PL62]|uniref:hypothetical protein n=1 Tax=Planctomyces sp. SH-PL62 TaxID=1636152 RepID=UPI00078E9CD8|nr:hypothetical protein [Planctomyces sp. SH-PL62]AMV36169.1 hypothetical protein VT85_01905 [Planctomyces sp. SH-PL62]
MSLARERERAGRLAARDFDAAIQVARNLEDPWFRCQALADVARYAAEPKTFLRVIDQALEAGWSLAIPNRAATVVAWPVAALAERRPADRAEADRVGRTLRAAVARVASVVALEPSPISRADALLIHVHALSPKRLELRNEVLGLFVQACRDPRNRKGQRQLEQAVLVVAGDDVDSALGLAASLNEGRRTRAVALIRDRVAWLGPRSFFHSSGRNP